MKNENKNGSYGPRERYGMYFSLAVCLIAIGMAAWGTFVGVSGFIDGKTEGSGTLSRTEENSSLLESAVDTLPESKQESNQENSETSKTESSELDEENPIDDQVNALPYKISEKFNFPVENHTPIKDFSDGELVYNEVMNDYRVHQGTDFPASIDETVYSCANGVVTKCYNDLLLGNVVVIEHGDYEFRYCGLSDNFFVKEGDVIAAKDEIGKIFNVPLESNTSHLHLEVHKDGETINPMSVDFE